jgi:hypothetical protein
MSIGQSRNLTVRGHVAGESGMRPGIACTPDAPRFPVNDMLALVARQAVR